MESEETTRARGWEISRSVRVRSAGFPYSLLEELRLIETSRRLGGFGALDLELDVLGARLEPILALHPTPWKTRVSSLKKRVRSALETKAPIREEGAAPHAEAEWREAVEAWNALAEARARTEREIEAQFERLRGAASLVVRGDRHAASRRDLLQQPASSDDAPRRRARRRATAAEAKTREREITAMMFAQRFCAKNDSISYYGPIYWARVDRAHASSIDFVHRPDQLVSRRAASLEQWAAASLAAAFSATPELRPFFAPRIRPGYALFDDGLRRADGVRVQVSNDELRVLGRIELGVLIADLIAGGEVKIFEALEARGIVDARLRIPGLRNGERLIFDALRSLPSENPARVAWEEKLGALTGAIETFASTPLEHHADRQARFLAMEREFEQIVGERSRRREGQIYAGRSMLYEDCERNFEHFVIGGGLVYALDGLAPLLDFASWTMQAFGEREHDRYRSAYRALAETRSAPVPLYKLYRAALESNALAGLSAQRFTEQIEAAWAGYLDERHPGWRDAAEVELEPEAIAAVLSRLPPAKPIPERSVFVQSPDLMIAAESREALDRGDYRIVLGELHKGVFVAVIPWATVFQSDPGSVAEDFRAWCGDTPLMDLAPPDGNRAEANWPDSDLHVQVDHDSGCPSVSLKRLLPIADLEVVEGEDGWLWIRSRKTPDERHFFLEVVRREFIRHLLSIEPISVPGARVPRMNWGRVVLSRRRWRLSPDQFPQLPEHGFALFGALRAWAAKLGLPERLFVRVPSEPKPFLVDFANYFSLEILAKQMRKEERMSISEMLPGAQDLWLTGPEPGSRYTVELRFTFYRPASEARSRSEA